MLARSLVAAMCCCCLAGTPAAAQHDMSMHQAAGPLPAFPGQAAFTTIGEVVAILKADSSTDWSKVDLDALREHLIDMDDVVMHASVVKKNVPGGLEARVTGSGRTVAGHSADAHECTRRCSTKDPQYHAVASRDSQRRSIHGHGEGRRERGPGRADSRSRVCGPPDRGRPPSAPSFGHRARRYEPHGR